MRSLLEVAARFLEVRAPVVKAEEKIRAGKLKVPPLGYYRLLGMMEVLAWVLGVDLRQMNAPKAAAEVEPIDEVTVSWIDAYGCYLVEFPPDEMQARQEYRAEFVSVAQAQQLLDELRLHVLNRAHLVPAEYEEVVRRDREERARKREQRELAHRSPVQIGVVRARHRISLVPSVSVSSSSSGCARAEGDPPEGA